MKINLSNIEKDKCDYLLKIKEANLLSAEIYIDYLSNYSKSIKTLKNNSYYRTFKDTIDNESLNNNEEFLIKNNHINEFTKLSRDDYLNNEYVKRIKNDYFQLDNVRLGELSYQKYEAFTYDDIKIDPTNYQEITPFGYFDKEFSYLAISEDDEIWMSLIPHEINTMKPLIQIACGNVLILGLGLGYLAYMVNLKKDVKKIVIIEQDEKIIEIFNKHLLPKLGFIKEVKIIKDDAFDYLAYSKEKFDTVLCDLWHNVGDGLSLFLRLKAYEAKSKAKFAYWIETSLLAMLRRMMLTIYEEQTVYHYNDDNYQIAENENDKIINALYYATKNVKIENFSDLYNLLSDGNLTKIALKLNYK